MDGLELSEEQKDKLAKLDMELKRRAEYEKANKTRKEQQSLATGIPANIIDLDVIRIGKFLGLIKNKSVLEGKESGQKGTFLDLIFGNDEPKFDKTKIPRPYKNSSPCVSELEKIEYHQTFVQKQCDSFANMSINTIQERVKQISQYIVITLDELTPESFISVCKENMEVIFEEVLSCSDSDELDELWPVLTTLRQSLLGPMNIYSYKRLLVEQITRLSQVNKTSAEIQKHLTGFECYLSMYNNCLLKKDLSFHVTDSDRVNLVRELQFRTFTKDPVLKVFDYSDLVKQSCVPSLLLLPLDMVLEFSMLGPYMNNSIGYLNLNGKESPWSFYILRDINTEGVRFWVLDINLLEFTKRFTKSLLIYLANMFRTFYFECFNTNKFIDDFWTCLSTTNLNKHLPIFQNLIDNLALLSNSEKFRKLLMTILMKKSCLIPTEYDYYDHLSYYPKPNSLVNYKSNAILQKLFSDNPSLELMDRLSEYFVTHR